MAMTIKETEDAISSLKSAISVLEADEATAETLLPYQKALKKYEAQLVRLQKKARASVSTRK